MLIALTKYKGTSKEVGRKQRWRMSFKKRLKLKKFAVENNALRSADT